MSWSAVSVVLAFCGWVSLNAQAQEAIADFRSGPSNGAYTFSSSNPKALPDLVKPVSAPEPASIVGHLFLPPGGEKVPAVVLMHGSGGIYEAMLDYWPKLLNAQGVAVFSLDRFGPRGVKSTAEDQSQVPFSADVADGFAALKLLASHPKIDAGRIAIMGFSRGGIASWRTAVERIIAAQQLADGLRFVAHIQVYSGGCAGVFRLIVRPGVFSKAPQLWIHGDADDYTPITQCQDYAKQIGEAGTPIAFLALPGAFHKFDYDDQRHIVLREATRTTADCSMELDIDTLTTYDHNSGQRLSGDAYKQALKTCSAIGASVQGNKGARDAAGQATVAFLRKVFGL